MSNGQHDIEKQKDPKTGGDVPKVPDPSKIEQGSKNPDTRDEADKADRPKPR